MASKKRVNIVNIMFNVRPFIREAFGLSMKWRINVKTELLSHSVKACQHDLYESKTIVHRKLTFYLLAWTRACFVFSVSVFVVFNLALYGRTLISTFDTKSDTQFDTHVRTC